MNTTSPNILMYKKANLGGTNNITLTKEESVTTMQQQTNDRDNISTTYELPFRVQFDKFMCQLKRNTIFQKKWAEDKPLNGVLGHLLTKSISSNSKAPIS